MATKTSKTSRPKLNVQKRTVLGRKIKQLRQQGILPANIFGKKVKSLAVQVEAKSFLTVLKEAGETGIIDLIIEKEKEARPVLIHNVQTDSVSDQYLHVDFHQVDLKEKITAEVPVELSGESPAVKERGGVLIQMINEIEVEALPTDLPEKFVLSVNGLKEIDQSLTIADLQVPSGVTIQAKPEQVIVKIEPPTKEEVVTPPPAAEAPAEGEAKEGKPAEGAPAAEKAKPEAKAGEPAEKTQAKPEEKPKEEKK